MRDAASFRAPRSTVGLRSSSCCHGSARHDGARSGVGGTGGAWHGRSPSGHIRMGRRIRRSERDHGLGWLPPCSGWTIAIIALASTRPCGALAGKWGHAVFERCRRIRNHGGPWGDGAGRALGDAGCAADRFRDRGAGADHVSALHGAGAAAPARRVLRSPSGGAGRSGRLSHQPGAPQWLRGAHLLPARRDVAPSRCAGAVLAGRARTRQWKLPGGRAGDRGRALPPIRRRAAAGPRGGV